MKQLLYMILLFIIIIFIQNKKYAQSMSDDFDPLSFVEGKSKFFARFQENIYKEDEFIDELNNDEKNKRLSYYRVFFNQYSKPKTIGFYRSKIDSELGIKITRLSHQINRDSTPYFIIKYNYNPENEKLVESKILKDKNGRIISSYYYYWNNNTINNIKKIERYGQTNYLYQMELKNYVKITWNKSFLKDLSFFNKSKQPIEKYTFMDNLNVKGSLISNIPEFSVGNNNIFIGYLKRYDRFKIGSNSEKVYYIEFSPSEKNTFVEKKFNEDGVLFQEKIHSNLPKMNSK